MPRPGRTPSRSFGLGDQLANLARHPMPPVHPTRVGTTPILAYCAVRTSAKPSKSVISRARFAASRSDRARVGPILPRSRPRRSSPAPAPSCRRRPRRSPPARRRRAPQPRLAGAQVGKTAPCGKSSGWLRRPWRGAEGAEISPRWEAALLAFARDQDRRGAAPATKRAYGNDLRELARMGDRAAASSPASFGTVTSAAYAAALSSAGSRRPAIARKLAAVRGFLEGLVSAGADEANPAELLPTPKREQRLPRALGREQVAELLDRIPAGSPLEIRDRAMFELAYSCGLRAEEIVKLDTGSIDFDDEPVRVLRQGLEGTARARSASPRRRRLRRYLETARHALADEPRRAGAVPLAQRPAPVDLRRPAAASEVGLRARHCWPDLAACAPPFVRDAPARGGRGPALDPGAPGPLERFDDAGVHTS